MCMMYLGMTNWDCETVRLVMETPKLLFELRNCKRFLHWHSRHPDHSFRAQLVQKVRQRPGLLPLHRYKNYTGCSLLPDIIHRSTIRQDGTECNLVANLDPSDHVVDLLLSKSHIFQSADSW